MSIQTINVGSTADDGTGDPLRTAMTKANSNFDFLNAESIAVSSARDLANTDANNVLIASGTFDLTLPDDLDDDTIILVVAVSGTVGIVGGTGATLEGGDFDLDATSKIAAVTLLHTTAGQWYALGGTDAAPAAEVVASGTGLTLDETHDGAIIEVGNGETVTTGGSLPAGWSCTLVRVGATSATIARGTGHTLNGPGGDAASFTIDSQWQAAALYARGSDAFVLIGPVS